MKATVVRQGSHQGVKFVEVQEFNDKGLAGPSTYAVPGDFPVGTQLEILVTEVESAEEKQATEDAKAEVVEEKEVKAKATKGK